MDKIYRYLEEATTLDFISTDPDIVLELQLIPKPRQQITKVQFKLDEVAIKGVTAKGIRMTPKGVKKVVQVKGHSQLVGGDSNHGCPQGNEMQ